MCVVVAQAKVWDVNRCMLLHTLMGHNAAVFAVDMNEAGSIVITGSADRVRGSVFFFFFFCNLLAA